MTEKEHVVIKALYPSDWGFHFKFFLKMRGSRFLVLRFILTHIPIYLKFEISEGSNGFCLKGYKQLPDLLLHMSSEIAFFHSFSLFYFLVYRKLPAEPSQTINISTILKNLERNAIPIRYLRCILPTCFCYKPTFRISRSGGFQEQTTVNL